MTPPTAQQVYSHLMRESFGPALRAAGLRGSNGRFEWPSATYWSLLGFQKSAFSDADAVRFTVNLSVIRRESWAEQASVKPQLGRRPAPNTFYGTWADQVRIGRLTESADDLWWWLRQGDDPAPVAGQVTSVLVDLAVPRLAARSRV